MSSSFWLMIRSNPRGSECFGLATPIIGIVRLFHTCVAMHGWFCPYFPIGPPCPQSGHPRVSSKALRSLPLNKGGLDLFSMSGMDGMGILYMMKHLKNLVL